MIIDPLSEESTPLISLAESLHIHSAPLRIGFVFITNYNPSMTGASDASVAVNNAFHYFMESKSSKEALQFLASVSNFQKNRYGKEKNLNLF